MAKQTNTFFDTDFTRIMDQFKFPGFDAEAILTMQRRNFEAMTTASQVAAEGLREVAKRQTEIMREGVEAYASAAREMFSIGGTEDKTTRQAESAKQAYETGIANAQELSQMVVKAQGDALEVISRRVSEGLDEFVALVGNGAVAKTTTTPKSTGGAAKGGVTSATA